MPVLLGFEFQASIKKKKIKRIEFQEKGPAYDWETDLLTPNLSAPVREPDAGNDPKKLTCSTYLSAGQQKIHHDLMLQEDVNPKENP